MNDKIKLAAILASASVASLGTFPYAKNFSQTLFNSHYLVLLFAFIFIISAVSANIALGTYSLYNTMLQIKRINISKNLFTVVACLFSALANGFICFIGYSELLPTTFNIIISTMVAIVNAGIGFSAINNAISDLKENIYLSTSKARKIERSKIILYSLTIAAAILVSLTAYFAGTQGLAIILKNFHIHNSKHFEKIIYLSAVMIWFPWAALFVYGSNKIVKKLYEAISRRNFHFSKQNIIISVIAIFSGSAYAQMALEFFDSEKCVPSIFKVMLMQNSIVLFFIILLAFIISAVVNAYALNELATQIKQK